MSPTQRRAPAPSSLLRSLALLACAGVLVAASARPARADGAFPDSLGIVTPAALPHDFFLATNFGLMTSVDDGQTWQWTCENDKTSYGFQYQLGPPPGNRLFALSTVGLVFSDDGACTWRLATTPVPGMSILDAFPDPADPTRVLAIALDPSVDGGPAALYRVLESSDGGLTFGGAVYVGAAGDSINGVEISRARPATIYVTLISGAAYAPKLERSTSGGAQWQAIDLRAALGAETAGARIIAVDPDDPLTVLLRVRSASGERLAVTTDGGDTFRTPVQVTAGSFTAFARLADGTLVLGGSASEVPVAFRSTDHGQTFQPLPAPPNLRGLSARGNLLYGAASNYVDGYALAVSADRGESWQPLMNYQDVQAIAACVKAQCQDECHLRTDQALWAADRCDATAAPRPVDAGTDGGSAGAGGDGPDRDAAGGQAPDAVDAAGSMSDGPEDREGGSGIASRKGCGCTASGRDVGPAGLLLLAVTGLACGRRRRRPR